eukprot:16190-Heterococcus_DN1.PRE.2
MQRRVAQRALHAMSPRRQAISQLRCGTVTAWLRLHIRAEHGATKGRKNNSEVAMAQGRLELAKILAQIILSDKKISFDDSVHYIPNKKLTEQALAHREPSSSVRKASPPDSLLTDCTPAVLEKAQTEQRNTACCHETAIGHRCSST